MNDVIRLSAAEIEYFLENGEGLDSFLEGVLGNAVRMLEKGGGKNVIINKIIIENDLETDDEETDDDDA